MNLKKSYSVFLLSLVLFVLSCDKFEYSPYDNKSGSSLPSGLNKQNLKKLAHNEAGADDTITFVFSGDCQRFYNQLDRFVRKVNSIPDIDFVLLCGDIADFGIREEYAWVTERLAALHAPYLGIIGNHDIAAEGGELFKEVFGPDNQSFTYKKHKFIMHNTNSREYNFSGNVPNLPWLKNELNDTTVSYFIGASHVPPFDVDFDPALEIPYSDLLNSKHNFILSLHGHLHSKTDSYYYNDHVRYMTCNALRTTELTIIRIVNGQISKKEIAY